MISFTCLAIAFAFIVLGLLEVEVVRRKNVRTSQGCDDWADAFGCRCRHRGQAAKISMLSAAFVSILTGIIVWSFALLAGIELATAWGVIAFVLNYIPFIGPLVATVFPTVFALVQFGSWNLLSRSSRV